MVSKLLFMDIFVILQFDSITHPNVEYHQCYWLRESQPDFLKASPYMAVVLHIK